MEEKSKQAKIILQKLQQIPASVSEIEKLLVSPEIRGCFKSKEIFALLNVFSKRNPQLSSYVNSIATNISTVYKQNCFSVVYNKITISFYFVNKYPEIDKSNHIHRFWNDCYYIRKYFPQKRLFNSPITFYYPPETKNIENNIKFFKLCNVLYNSIEVYEHSDDFIKKVNKYKKENILQDIIKMAEDWGNYQLLFQILDISEDNDIIKSINDILARNLSSILEAFSNERRKTYLKYLDMLKFENIFYIFSNCNIFKLTQKQIYDFFFIYSQKFNDIRAVCFLQFIKSSSINDEQRQIISQYLNKFNCLHLYPQFATKEDIRSCLYLY